MNHDPNDPLGWTPSENIADQGSSQASSSEEALPPPTEPAGALVPPPKTPVTALSTAAEPPSPPPKLPAARWGSTIRESRRAIVVGGSFDLIAAVNRVLDTLDVVGDRIAEVAGIRPPAT